MLRDLIDRYYFHLDVLTERSDRYLKLTKRLAFSTNIVLTILIFAIGYKINIGQGVEDISIGVILGAFYTFIVAFSKLIRPKDKYR